MYVSVEGLKNSLAPKGWLKMAFLEVNLQYKCPRTYLFVSGVCKSPFIY
uniref:Transposase n=1 Tax=Haemonchus contortus TaxID=6289 RepID=A0A7I5EF36_HAECO